MNTLVVYSTKHGATRQYAEDLARELPGQVTVVDLKAETTVDVSPYDTVVIGGCIYFGQVQKELKEFCANNSETLRHKRLALFTCGWFYDQQPELRLQTAFPAELLASATVKESLGGKMDPSRMNFMEKLVTRMVSGKLQSESRYSAEGIKRFAQALK
jgi:menaquinone-dependent protoporphyrinogen oxidase